MKKTIIITGIDGFLASNLLNLLQEQFTIYGIGKTAKQIKNVKVFSSDEIESIDIRPDYLVICHAAIYTSNKSQENQQLFDVNVNLTERLTKTFNSSKFIYISSVSIFEFNNKKISEKSQINPQSPYSISKYWAETLVLNNSNSVILRVSSIFGIGMKENTIIANYTNQALNNNTIEVWGNGERRQNYIHVTDVCEYIKLTIEKFDLLTEKLLLVVHSKEFSNNNLAEIIANETKSNIIFIKEDNSKSVQYNNKITNKELAWKPKANFKKEIIKYIKWKKKQF